MEDKLAFLLISGVCAFLVYVTFLEAKWKHDNPCVTYGEEETSLIVVGKSLIPVTEKKCLKRKNVKDVE